MNSAKIEIQSQSGPFKAMVHSAKFTLMIKIVARESE